MANKHTAWMTWFLIIEARFNVAHITSNVSIQL